MHGYITVETKENEIITEEKAKEELINIVNDLSYRIKNLDLIIKAIDDKNTQYINNAVSRAKFMLTSGNDTEGKINEILKAIVTSMEKSEKSTIENILEINNLFRIFPQGYVSNESLHTIPVIKTLDKIEKITDGEEISEVEKRLYIEEIREKTNVYYSRRNVNEYVSKLLDNKDKISCNEIPMNDLKDFIRIMYMYVYSDEELNCYTIEKSNKRIELAGHKLNYFELVRKESKN